MPLSSAGNVSTAKIPKDPEKERPVPPYHALADIYILDDIDIPEELNTVSIKDVFKIANCKEL
jgi:hypothetical protein